MLKNDKFNYYIDDKTSVPVREAVADLLGIIYPSLKDDRIFTELVQMLSRKIGRSSQRLISLKSITHHIYATTELIDYLEVLLKSQDEDVKYQSRSSRSK